MKDFHHLFQAGVQEMYAGEKEILKAVPALIQAVKEPKLKEAFREHLEETKHQAKRLEEIAKEMDFDLTVESCPVIHALLQRVHKCAIAHSPHDIKDAAIIAAAQCVEHYEICVYGTLKSYACLLKLDFAKKKLDESLHEEGKSDKALSEIAEGTFFSKGVNQKACG